MFKDGVRIIFLRNPSWCGGLKDWGLTEFGGSCTMLIFSIIRNVTLRLR